MMKKYTEQLVNIITLIVLVDVLTILLPGPLHAQSSSTGIIQGHVVDDSTGVPLQAVNVMVAGTPYGASTNAEGFYLLRNIPAGEHTLQFRYVGYREVQIEDVIVLPSLRTTVDARMPPTILEMPPVIVSAERPLIQTDITGTLHSVGAVTIQRLPIDTFQDIVELQPGVVAGGHIRGGRASETLFILDGIPIQDPTGGGAALALPKSALTEVDIHTGGFDAEYGNALSGVVQLTTRRGTNSNEFLLRDDRDNFGELFGGTEHSGRYQAEALVSGPIVSDRLFYLLAADYMQSNTRWWQDFDRTNLPRPHQERWNVFGRSDLYLSQVIRASFEWIESHGWERGYEWRWRKNLPGLPDTWFDNRQFTLTLNHMLSPTTFYDLHFSQLNISNGVYDGSGEALEFKDLWEYDPFLQYVESGERLWWFRGKQVIRTLQGSIISQIKRHRLKVGIDLEYFNLDANLIKFEPQTTFYGLPKLGLNPLNFSYDYLYSPRAGAAFIQDTFESGNGLIIKAGLRYDWLNPRAERPFMEWVPLTSTEFEQQITKWVPASRKEMLSPRIGWAYPIDTRTFFLFNYGQFFQVPLFDQLYSGIHVNLERGHRVLLGNPDLKHQKTMSYEFSVRREFNPSTVGAITLFFKEAHRLVDTKTYTAANSTALEDGFTQYVNLPLARSSGLELSYEQRPTENFGFKVAYTYMHARGQAETELSGLNYLQWGFEPPRRMHYLSWDQRHTLVVETMGLYRGIHFVVVSRFNTPRPYTYAPSSTGVLPEGTEVEPNNERMEEILRLDAKLSKDLSFSIANHKLIASIFVDIRNLTDRKNVNWISSNGQVGGELGDPGAYQIGRRTRIGIEFRFR